MIKKTGEHKRLQYSSGRYFVDIDITVDEWKEMLLDEKIFYPEAKSMVLAWYFQEDHMATSKTIMNENCPELKGTPYNGCVKGLTTGVLKHLNYRFWVEDSGGNNRISYWCIPFEGWHINYDTSKRFVWKLRDELVQAIDETPDFYKGYNNDNKNYDGLESSIIKSNNEGRIHQYYTTKYERNSKNRDAAIRIAKKKNGGKLCCEACGLNFEDMYGERGKDFIEVHHNKPLSQLGGEVEINPAKDLNCVCSNCHRMIHRNKSNILTVKQLKNIIMSNKK